MVNQDRILIYQTEDNQTQIDVRLDEETVWLTQKQMELLFDTTKQNISLHINNIFRESELLKSSVVKDYLTTASDGKNYKIKFYNLDVIISVGYRVKSKRGTQFRIWANKILKEFLVQGYSLNNKLLKSQNEKLNKLNEVINFISSVSNPLFQSSDQITSFLKLLQNYSVALNLLDDYDYKRYSIILPDSNKIQRLEYQEVKTIIQKMKEELGNSELFGKEKDESLKSSIGAIYQTFDGNELYPSIFEKASNLLYFIVKNHSFIDGNKRIAAAVFLYFLNMNGYFMEHSLSNDLLATLTLMIANGNPEDKDLMVNIVAVILQRK